MNLIAINFPAVVPVLESKRLRLSPIVSDDVAAYFALCANQDVMRSWGTKFHQTKQETLDLIELLSQMILTKQLIRWAIRERDNPALIGDIGFWRFVAPRLRAEIGAKLLPTFWNNSYMTEAMSAVIDYGFNVMNLNSIEGNIDPENHGSIRLVAKLGFENDGFIKEHSYCYYREKFIGTQLYSLRASQWKLKPPSV